jgi:tight adherence protein C
MDLIGLLLQPETLLSIFIAVAVFGTVVSVTAPVFEGDKLQGRMKNVVEERERLKQQQRAALSGGDTRLRDIAKPGLYNQVVQMFNLKKLFQADAAREALRQSGYRSETHLVTFLAARLIAPIVLSVLTFAYASTALVDSLTVTMRIGVTIGALVFGFYLPQIMLSNLKTRRQKSIKRAWSDSLDLLLICVEAGMALEPALQRVAKEIGVQSVPLAEELTLTIAELSYLQDRRKALDNLAKRTGLDTVKAVVTSLIQSERYGTPLGTALRVLAQENRDSRMAEAEKKAAALPPKLTVPMILFFLPVIFVIVLGPSILVVTNAR